MSQEFKSALEQEVRQRLGVLQICHERLLTQLRGWLDWAGRRPNHVSSCAHRRECRLDRGNAPRVRNSGLGRHPPGWCVS